MINMLLYQILAFTIHKKNIKKSYKNNKFKISAPTWHKEFELTDRSYSASDIKNILSISSKNMRQLLIFLQ